jgi:hypothetical protein
VGVDLVRLPPPRRSRVGEVADQFLLLRVHAADRQPLVAERVDAALDVAELLVPVGVVRSGEAFDVDVQVVTHVPEQVAYRGRAGIRAAPRQFVAERLEAAAPVLGLGQGVAAGDRFDQFFQGLDDRRVFFSRSANITG